MPWISGVGLTPFGRHAQLSHRDLATAAARMALADAGHPKVDAAIVGACGLATWGQANVKGPVVLDELVRDGTLPPGTPMPDVDAACATGSVALHAAIDRVRAGEAEAVLVVGVDKTWMADPVRVLQLFAGGIDQLDPARWQTFVAAEAEKHGLAWDPRPERIVFLDLHALQAQHHMKRWGTTVAHLAQVSAKNHVHGALNPNAHHRKPMSTEAVLADFAVLHPFTRAMCGPISDGAAAVVVTREALGPRSVRVAGTAQAGGRWRTLDEPDVTALAADRLWRRSGFAPHQVQVAEVHDASSFCEIQATELLGLCPVGEGGAWSASGASSLGGAVPVNPSGGLESRGHPLAATGLAMIHELVTQLRGEAADRQVPGAEVALAHNEGGMIGVDHALCALTLLTRR